MWINMITSIEIMIGRRIMIGGDPAFGYQVVVIHNLIHTDSVKSINGVIPGDIHIKPYAVDRHPVPYSFLYN